MQPPNLGQPQGQAEDGRVISLAGLPSPYAAALALATLAYPEWDEEWRQRIAMRLLGSIGLEKVTIDYKWYRSEIAPDVPLPIDFKELKSGRKRFDERIRKRIDAGNIAIEPILAVTEGRPLIHEWGGRWSRLAAIRRAVDGFSDKDPRNFARRHWSPSLPVLHLAAALCVEAMNGVRIGDHDVVTRLVKHPRALLGFLTRAQSYETAVATSALRVPTSTLIRVRGWESVGQFSE